MNTRGLFSSLEIRDLTLSLIALTIAFYVLDRGIISGFELFIICAFGVGSGFILHELMHKFVAMHFGYIAEYRANMAGLALAIVMSFMGFIFAAPGGVMIQKIVPLADFYTDDPAGAQILAKKEKRDMLFISLAGPLTNILLVWIFAIAGAIVENRFLLQVTNYSFNINLILGAFNLLPFGPLDGKKIFDANMIVWAVISIPTILFALFLIFV